MIGPTNAFVPEASIGAGLSINVGKGTVRLSGTTTTYVVETNVILVANTFNYVFINTTSGAIQSNTSGFTSTCIPIATVLTGNSSVMVLTDNRPDYFVNSTAASGGTDTVQAISSGQTLSLAAGTNLFGVCTAGAGGFTLVLPSATGLGGNNIKLIKSDTGAGIITITGSTSTYFLTNQYQVVVFETDGTTWFIASNN